MEATFQDGHGSVHQQDEWIKTVWCGNACVCVCVSAHTQNHSAMKRSEIMLFCNNINGPREYDIAYMRNLEKNS